MGVFSKIHRFREAGQDANVNNVEKFGAPVLSLFTTTKFFTLHHHIDVVDDHENVVYESNSKMISLHDKKLSSCKKGKNWCSKLFYIVYIGILSGFAEAVDF